MAARLSVVKNIETMNTVMIRVYRSLLQYAGECWPWAAAKDASSEAAVREMAAEEQRLAARIFAWLDQREAPVDLGTYPDNSSLHYVSLPFLLRRVASDHTELAAFLKQAQATIANDSLATGLVGEILGSVERHLARLTELAAVTARSEAAA